MRSAGAKLLQVTSNPIYKPRVWLYSWRTRAEKRWSDRVWQTASVRAQINVQPIKRQGSHNITVIKEMMLSFLSWNNDLVRGFDWTGKWRRWLISVLPFTRSVLCRFAICEDSSSKIRCPSCWTLYAYSDKTNFLNVELRLTICYYCSPQLSGAIYLQNSSIVEGREREI